MTRIDRQGQSIDMKQLETDAKRISDASLAESRVVDAAKRYVDLKESERTGGSHQGAAQSFVTVVERDAQRFGIDLARFHALKDATPEELAAAKARAKALYDVGAISMLAWSGRTLSEIPASAKTSSEDKRWAVDSRQRILDTIGVVRSGLEAAGACSATANFPEATLGAIEKLVKKDLEELATYDPPAKPAYSYGSSYGSYGSYGGSKSYEPPVPKLEDLPAPKVLRQSALSKLEDAAKAIADSLQKPGLQKAVESAFQAVPAHDRPAFAGAMQGYAVLCDEAAAGIDYANAPRMAFTDRASYLSRKDSSQRDAPRQAESRQNLAAALERALASDAKVPAAEAALAAQFAREVGVPAGEAAAWKGNTGAIIAALEGDAFLPLRSYNELCAREAQKQRGAPLARAQAAAQALTQSVVEGRFEQARAQTPQGQVQLARLTDAQRDKWLGAGVTLTHEAKEKDGAVTFTTRELRGVERFWGTKVGGPSHGFDSFMAQCALALPTNPRNEMIAVFDPRWRNVACRSYFRLVYEDQTHKPVLFLEGSQKDFPYRGSTATMERYILKHAIARALDLGIELSLSPFWSAAVRETALPGTSRMRTYVLEPAVVIEAGDAFGKGHDWYQPNRETFTQGPFLVDLTRLPADMKP